MRDFSRYLDALRAANWDASRIIRDVHSMGYGSRWYISA